MSLETDGARHALAPRRSDVLLALALALGAALACLAAGRRIDPRLVDPRADDLWFGSDIPYRLEVMQQPGGWDNGGAHPLFPTIGHALLVLTAPLTRSADPMRRATIAGAVAAALFTLTLFVLFRRMRLPPLDAALFAGIGATSAGALFWFPVPESFGLAGLGVALALLAAAGAPASFVVLTAGCVASASCILTNGVVGALAAFAHHSRPRQWPRALAIGLSALGVMALVWSVQEWSHATPFFLSERLLEYRQHLYPPSVERTAQVLQGLLSHSVVAPEPQAARASFRRVPVLENGPIGGMATLAWLALLGLGATRTAQLARRGERRPLAWTAAGGLALFVAMHLTLGREMFLYAMDVLPLLLTLAAAAASHEARRWVVRGLALTLLLAGAGNNFQQLDRAADRARALAAERLAAPAGEARR
jgi:hypothetical protein